MKRSTKPLRRTPLRKQSKKRAKESRVYTKLRKQFLEDHPICQRCEKAKSDDVHHVHGRLSGNYLKVSTWAALCRTCHDLIHNFPTAARQEGWLRT